MLCYVVLCVVHLSCGSSSRPQDTPPPEIHQLRYQESSRSVSFSVSAASCKGIDSNCLHENLIMLFLLSLLMQFIQINSFEVRLQMLPYHIFESRIPPSHCTALHCTALHCRWRGIQTLPMARRFDRTVLSTKTGCCPDCGKATGMLESVYAI